VKEAFCNAWTPRTASLKASRNDYELPLQSILLAKTWMTKHGMCFLGPITSTIITVKGEPLTKHEFITALEAVSADGFVYPRYIIGKGSVHIFDWYKNVGEEDHNARWAESPKGWTDSNIGYDWLTNVEDPISKAGCPREPRLLILDGHVSHINYKFLTLCKAYNIVVFCLPPHSTHLL